MRISLFFTFLFLLALKSFSQEARIGEWKSYLNYTEGIMSAEVGKRIYCATSYGLFYYDKSDKTNNPLSKTNGFSDTKIITMGYDEETSTLMIAYENSNIDLVKNNRIINAPEIYRKFISGKKELYNIDFHNKLAYIASSFGIVVYDLDMQEVKESYTYIGESGEKIEVYCTTVMNDTLFASTSNGVRCASLQSENLLDFKNWKTIYPDTTTYMKNFDNQLFVYTKGIVKKYKNGKWSNFIDTLEYKCKNIESYNGHLLITFNTGTLDLAPDQSIDFIVEPEANACLIDKDGTYWFAKKFYSLVEKTKTGETSVHVPNCPSSRLTWNLKIHKSTVYVSSGSITSQWGPMYNSEGVYVLKDDFWENWNYRKGAEYKRLQDVITLAIRPSDGVVFAGSYDHGLAEITPDGIIKYHDNTNSTLSKDINSAMETDIRIAGLAFDQRNDLWVSNFRASKPLSKYDGENWTSYSIGSIANNGIADIEIDEGGKKWLVLGQGGGIVVFDDERETDNLRYYKTAEGQGNLPSESVTDIEMDLEGRMWIGTTEGLAVVYDPYSVFSGYNYDAQQIWLDQGNESGYLLGTEMITAIAVDGANNKWIGSRNGVWYVNDDGSKIIYNFTKENSPLPDNVIRDIEADPITGEVFFATDLGIVSFRSFATEGGLENKDVYAYPNPVKPDYKGIIAIKGFVKDANVKITDVSGNIVFETFAEGGQATWDGRNFSGNEVKSGVYLVMGSDEDGIETIITKILIIR